MTWIARTLFTLLATVLTATAAGGWAADEPVQLPEATPQEVSPLGEVTELTPAQSTLMTTSLERFTQAGLEAPVHVVPSFHKSMDACNGNLGLSTIEDGVARVRVCWSHENPGVELRLQEQALVHELAHAWAKVSLDDARRDAFVEFTESSSWDLAAHGWNDRGTERSADLITWALLDPAVLFVDFDNGECHTWAPAFELLTGVDAPGPLTGACVFA